jgi:hypothetical protein
MSYLVFTDPHFTDRESDSDRWGLFPYIEDLCVKNNIKEVYILGDITEDKDRHSSILVNRLHKELNHLARNKFITILMGNHDYIDSKFPFFEFINNSNLDGGIKFVKEITDSISTLWLPHTRDWKSDWKSLDFSKYKRIFMHQTVEGAVDQAGPLKGIPVSVFDAVKSGTVFLSGDIHKHQTVQLKDSSLFYLGAPYPTRFGDSGGCIYIVDDFKEKPVATIYTMPFRAKATVKMGKDEYFELSHLVPNDRVKVTLLLERKDLPDYTKIKKDLELECQNRKLELHGVKVEVTDEIKFQPKLTAKDSSNKLSIFEEFTKNKKIDQELLSCGLEIFKEVEHD